MTAGAVLLMVMTMGIIAAFTVYFFVRILKAPLQTDDTQNDGKTS